MAAAVSLVRAGASIGQLCLEPIDDARLGIHLCPGLILNHHQVLSCSGSVGLFGASGKW